MRKIEFTEKIPQDFYWFNEPGNYYIEDGLVIETEAVTDFWQRTHYGFRNDNGHCLLTDLDDDFSFQAHFEFKPQGAYDQCGLFIRIDAENWIKVSTEYENKEISRLGSVVTNLGYSDWATTDISAEINSMWYKISRRGQDFLIENSRDGEQWTQMRITHLHKEIENLKVGIYACSPQESCFKCKVDDVIIAENEWEVE